MYVVGIYKGNKNIGYAYMKQDVGNDNYIKRYYVYKYESWANKFIENNNAYQFTGIKGARFKVVDVNDSNVDLKVMLMIDLRYLPLSIQHSTYISCLDIDETYRVARKHVVDLYMLLKKNTIDKDIVNNIYIEMSMCDSMKYKNDRSIYQKKIDVMKEAIDIINSELSESFGVV